MKPLALALGIVTALSLAGCTTRPGPVEVTRFVAPDRVAQLGQGSIFVESAPGGEANGLELSTYKAAVADELRRLGYSESSRDGAAQVAQISLERYVVGSGGRRNPVSVGVGGSTGNYGSGVGVGIGINLGGGQKDRLGTELAVTIREKASGQSIWEGRADFQAPENSALARGTANAQTVASALFREFPGNNGETIEVEVTE
ncbi:DUF4136 domain-containing protein [Qipengyuania qiaonensis]|uniref:DUF4136 domain-containing protein n=1 Tax=Qipengyuania qiaonensis TaxID=2867240 RepID=A0ABS7JCD5_9SPHN|nr:DUF4136 domain-containing protein [Qipengyuania qiaonensis]MBX7483991.1 DUF4136 domain-containing protein [Qipengyuania qiaonensis]